MSHLLPARWLAALPAICALSAAAQGTPSPEATGALTYRSAFENYQRFQDAPPVDWRQANDTVRARGGWRAYAKEGAAAEEEAATPAVRPDPHAGRDAHGAHDSHPAPPQRAKERP